MSTIEQSSVDIINIVQQAKNENKDIYVTKRGQVKVKRGVAGWWATRSVKTGDAKAVFHQKTIDKFANALIRESQHTSKNDSKTNSALQQGQTLPLLIRQIAQTQAGPSLTVNKLIEAKELTAKAVAADGQSVQHLIEGLKTGTTIENIAKSATTINSESQTRDTSQAKARLNQDITIITSALTKEDIQRDSLASALALATEEAERGVEGAAETVETTKAALTQIKADIYELQSAVGLLENLNLAVADTEKAQVSAAPGNAEERADGQTLTATENVKTILNNDDQRLTRIEERAGVTLSQLSDFKKQAFARFISATTFADYKVPSSHGPNTTDWRNRDIDDRRAVDILKFVASGAFTEDFSEEVERIKAKGVEALSVVAKLANKNVETLTDQERADLGTAFESYTSVVSDENALQTYFRFGRTDEQPTAPLEIRALLTERLRAGLSSEQQAKILLGLGNSESVINSIKGLSNAYNNSLSSKDRYGDPNGFHQIAPVIGHLVGNFASIVAEAGSTGIKAFDVDTQDRLLDPQQSGGANGDHVASSFNTIIDQQAESIQSKLAKREVEDYRAGLTSNRDYNLTDTEVKNTISTYYLSLALQGQSRAGERIKTPNSDDPAIKFTVTADPVKANDLKLQSYANDALKGSLSDLKTLIEGDERSVTISVNEEVQAPLETALNTAQTQFTSQALGHYKGQTQTLYFEGDSQESTLTVTSEGQHIRASIRRSQELQSFGIEASGPQLSPGQFTSQPGDVDKRAQAEETITFTIDKASLKNDSLAIVPGSVDYSLDFYVPITANRYT